MKGKLFGVTMFVLVLVLGLAMPASAAPRPPVQSLTVAHWTPADAAGTYNWHFAAEGINWQGYKPALVQIGHTVCDQAQGCPILIAQPDAVIPVNAKAYPYPQNLNVVDTAHTYNIVGSVGDGCTLDQFVTLIDSRGLVIVTLHSPQIPYCIVQVP